MVKLLEKQYQERLEEEVAKVSLQFIWKVIVVCIPFQPSKNIRFIGGNALYFLL